jgi:hypothetical protein
MRLERLVRLVVSVVVASTGTNVAGAANFHSHPSNDQIKNMYYITIQRERERERVCVFFLN